MVSKRRATIFYKTGQKTAIPRNTQIKLVKQQLTASLLLLLLFCFRCPLCWALGCSYIHFAYRQAQGHLRAMRLVLPLVLLPSRYNYNRISDLCLMSDGSGRY
jgi:hypothetical protein